MSSAASNPDWRASITLQNLAAALCSVAAFYVLFGLFPYAFGYGAIRASMFSYMSMVWGSLAEWEHCWLVPLAAVGLIYYRRDTLSKIPVQGHWLGLPALVVSLIVYCVGYLADNVYIGYVSLLGYIASLVLLMLGWSWLRALLFPIGFLVFMFPLPFMDNVLAFPLRIFMSTVSVAFLNVVGLSCLQQGTAIVSSPDFAAGLAAGERFAVDVADPCSGIRSLFALMMVSALYGYIAMDKPWQKWVVFLASMPLAVAGNFARIIMLTLGTVVLGPEVAIGSIEEPTTFHMLSGFLVFAVALGGMLGVGWLLQRCSPTASSTP